MFTNFRWDTLTSSLPTSYPSMRPCLSTIWSSYSATRHVHCKSKKKRWMWVSVLKPPARLEWSLGWSFITKERWIEEKHSFICNLHIDPKPFLTNTLSKNSIYSTICPVLSFKSWRWTRGLATHPLNLSAPCYLFSMNNIFEFQSLPRFPTWWYWSEQIL